MSNKYSFYSSDYLNISGIPFAYWISKNEVNAFKNPVVSDFFNPKKGVDTGENDKYLRMWYEVNNDDIGFNLDSLLSFIDSKKKYAPLNKGGDYRKWYGNNEYVINWEENGKALRSNGKANIRNEQFYFHESLTWTDLTSYKPSFRYNKSGFIHDVAGPCLFDGNEYVYYLNALLNSKVSECIFKIIAPTIHFNVGNIANVPFALCEGKREEIDYIVKDNIKQSMDDWNCFENSWDFKKHPLI